MTEKRIWEILRINPASSKREIRRAYAEQVKLHHPEDEPEAFAELNEAYQRAMQLAETETGTGTETETDHGMNAGGKTTIREEDSQEEKQTSTLLERLEHAQQEKIQASMQTGALGLLIGLLENAKLANKQESWKEFFLSEEFLTEQDQEEFGRGLTEYLNAQYDAVLDYRLPRAFVVELAIAYALYPETDGMVNTEGSFFNRTIAGQIWNIEVPKWDFSLDGLLYRRENLVRLRSFADYLTLRAMNRRGYLTKKEKDTWEDILMCGKINHLFECNSRTEIEKTTRSTCIVRLYAYWLSHEEVPVMIYHHIYREYDFHNLDRSSRHALYAGMKQAIFARCPEIEETLFGEYSREQGIRNVYQNLMQIVSDYHSCYDRREYPEPEEIRRRTEAFFARADWKELCHDPELFDQIYRQFARRKVVPGTMARKLSAFYQEAYPWPNPEEVQEILEGLAVSMSFFRNLLETDYRTPYPYEKTEISDVDMQNRDFWEYFLMIGYDCRCICVIGAVQKKEEYISGNDQYLPAYIRAVYLPSMEWRKRFTRFDDEDETISNPVSLEFPVPDRLLNGKKRFRLEFHLHYIQYFIDEEQVIYPPFSFAALLAAADELEKPEHFFFLLAAASIGEDERSRAEEEIARRLEALPLYPCTCSFIAKAIAADNARAKLPENEARKIRAVFYEEQERFCFKTEVSMRAMKLYRRTDLGWEEMKLLSGEGKAVKALDLEGKKQYAADKLLRMRQPRPIRIASYSLEGYSNEEKMAQIIEALKEQEKYRKRGKRSVPYSPGFPWSPEEISPAVREFFARDGGWMLESFVVLHMGTQKKKCFERIFYCAMNIFGFDLYFQSPEFASTCNHRTSALKQKIKEPHLVVGRFGWGKSYAARESYAPMPFAIGESKTFYAYDFLRLYRAKSLSELLAKLYDFSEVSGVDVYGNRLSVSRFDHTLEYCYTEEDFDQYLNSKEKMLPEIFTKFGI